MIELIKWLHDLIRDKGTKWFAKLILIFSILIVIYIVDDYFGWSYYSQANNKVELLKNINECLKDSLITDTERNFLMSEKSQLLSRKTIPNIFFDYSQSILTSSSNTKGVFENFKFEFFNGEKVVPIYRFVIINIGAFILCLFELIKIIRMKIARKRKVLATVLLFITFGLVSMFYTFLVSLIPVISENNIWINYIICLLVGILNTKQVRNEQKKGAFKKLIFE